MNLLQEKLGYNFVNPKLLEEALTHKSFSSEHNCPLNNERLEFLGDSVLGLVVSGYLYSKFPDKDEGFLSKSRSFLVSRESMSVWAAGLKLGFYLKMGAGEMMSGGKTRRNNLANVMEAVIGAVYLDGGITAAENVIMPWLLVQHPAEIPSDYKTLLQEKIQKMYKRVPEYEILDSSGPEHNKVFNVSVFLGKKTLGLGSGKSVKESQQNAAQNALIYLSTHKLSRKEIS